MARTRASRPHRGKRASRDTGYDWRNGAAGAHCRPTALAPGGESGGPVNAVKVREEAKQAFLEDAGWGDAKAMPLPGDASTRHYVRLHLGNRSALLMDQPQNAETPVAHVNTTPAERRALGYNALARLAGADCARFVAAARYLRRAGLSAPDIYAADTPRGLLLIED